METVCLVESGTGFRFSRGLSYPKVPNTDYNDLKVMSTELEKSASEAMGFNLAGRVHELESRIANLESGSTYRGSTRPVSKIAKKREDDKILFMVSKIDKGRRIDKEVEDLVEDDAPNSLHPIVVKSVFNDDGTKIDETQIIIKGSGLRSLLQCVLSTYLKHEFRSTFEKKEIILSKPFIPLEYNWEQLQAATKDPKTLENYGRESVDELTHLLNLVDRLSPESTQILSNIRDSRAVMKQHLYSLFKPGTLVITMPSNDNIQLMKVHHFGAGSTANNNDTSSVFCDGYDWDGKKLERLRYEFPMPKMESTEQFRVRDLPCYPIEMYEDTDGVNGIEELKKNLIKRGQKFEELCISQQEGGREYQYVGQFQVEGDLRSGLTSIYSRLSDLPPDLAAILRSSSRRSMNSQSPLADAKGVVIDHQSFLEYGPREARNGFCVPQARATPCNCPLCISEETKAWIASFGKSRDVKDVDDYALLPPRALGFALDSKLWGQFLVDGVGPNTEDAYQVFDEELIFPDGKDDKNKRIVKDLIMNHENHGISRITDSVEGKGQGLVLLFHGPPGVGKTMTAETLAKSCRKILLKVGIGDLGSTAEAMDRSLQKLFEVVTAWHAILLIDEADIFLDSRGSKGEAFPEQNAMVSVMLRLLEYFSGVLILTTNRVKSIDYAIMSRISYAIKFKDLTLEHQKTIYRNFLSQAKKKGLIKAGEKEKIDSMVNLFKSKERLNGRDIRTMFTTAQSRGKGRLTAENMNEIHEQLQSFKDDMNTLYILAERDSVVQ